ncbi:hypothetical protein ACFU8Q_28385 [Streptomyces sp. NPDC057543]|uniref:hypothetical protein n=1 Tax=Streptomyces sp. NPDC057543 TaxID=3346163 RepID=UPI00369D68EB
MGLSPPRPEGCADDRTEACREAGVTVAGAVPAGPGPGRPIPTVKNRLQEAP